MDNVELITIEQIDELLAFLPVFSDLSFEPVVDALFGYVIYQPEVEEFYRLVTQPWWCDREYDPMKVRDVIYNPEYIAQATLSQIKSMLTFCQRGERFCDGHRGNMIVKGVIARILKRLSELKEGCFEHGQ